MVVLGGALLWFGWVGFNAGSEGACNARASNAAFNTHFTACVAASFWLLCDFLRTKKLSSISLINGAVAGMVIITPAAGYIEPASCWALGAVAGIVCYFMCLLMKRFVDDSFDAFGVHGVAGFLGLLLTGIFAESNVISLDGIVSNGGFINRNWIQLAYQAAGACAAAVWSFVVTFLIIKAMQLIAKLAKKSIVHDE